MQISNSMSTTYKVILDQRRPNSKGKYPLKIRILQSGDYRDFSTKISVAKECWNEENQRVAESHEDSNNINTILERHKARVRRMLQLRELEEQPDPKPDEIVSALKRQGEEVNAPQKHSIIRYGHELAKKLELTGNIGNSIVYETATNRLRAYVKTEEFSFSELTYNILDDWNTAMLSEGLKVNAVANYMRTIRAIFNKAIKAGLANLADYPFSRFTIKGEKTKSRSLTREEMQQIASVIPNKPYLIPYQRLFLLSFCLIGINFVDLLTIHTEDVVEGRVVFRRKKTHKVYSIKLHSKAQELIAQLSSRSSKGYLLPFIPIALPPVALKKQLQLMEHRVNDGLKKIADQCGIKKQISAYYARYAWANIAKKSCGYSKDMIAEALGHEYGNKVTGIYLDEYETEVIDSMNEKVITTVFGNGKRVA